jgi:hypothetical protein
MGQDHLTDSWARAFEVVADGNLQIEHVVWQPVGSYNQPIDCSLKDGKVSVTGTINFGTMVPSEVSVVLLAPDPEFSRSELAVKADEDSNTAIFSFTNVPIGMRAICVDVNGQRLLTKYVQVPHEGLSLVFDLGGQNGNSNE